MSDSDSGSDADWDDIQERLNAVAKMSGNNTVVALRPSEEVYERWSRISADTKREAGQQMKIFAFWLPVLLQRDEAGVMIDWALQLGLITDGSEEITLQHLHKIEILEAILRALEKGTMKKDQTKCVVKISNMFNLRAPGALQEALHWLERTGEPAIRHRVMDLGTTQKCCIALHLVFTEFAKYIQSMGTNLERTMNTLMAEPTPYHQEKCEEMKIKGNENFQKKQYHEAVKFYSKAIRYYPENHKIYGNRALCYIRCQKYLKAVGDGKRATLIKPLWAKGHYRYCEALFFLGEVKKAIEANSVAQSLCKDDRDGIKDLEQQHLKFTEVPETKVEKQKKTQTKRPEGTNRAHAQEKPAKAVKVDPRPQNKVQIPEVKPAKQPVKNEKSGQSEVNAQNSKPLKSELFPKNGEEESNTPTKKQPKNRKKSENEKQKVDDKAALCKELRSMVQDAHAALIDLRSRNAEEGFRKALVILEATTAKDLGLSTMDVLLLLYGRASALIEIGQLEELGEARKLLERIRSFEERMFQCLVHYAVGRVYLKENRFIFALEQFSYSLQTVKNQITPGKLTWPLTKEVVKETQPDYFQEILEHAIELSKFPPNPDAICRLEKCLGPMKAEIYLTDPDFKGFIRIHCCQSCIIEYHTACWKTLKTSAFGDKNEKDCLQESCFTPDCVGRICSINIFGPTGLLKCKCEANVHKPQALKKPRVNQKCTSQKNLKAKEEHKLKRKQHKQSFQERQAINDEILQQREDSATQNQQKAWLLYRDRVLLQISQNMELLMGEKGLHVSALTHSLKPWLELDSSRGNQVADRILNWQQEQLETISQAVELLLERKNRVWARVLIQFLSTCLDINPKLNNWACQLNSAGLNAASSFIERYSSHLEQLDLAFLLNFGPLQEVIIEKLGTRPELFSSIGLTVTEYLKQAPAHDMRLFIWTLEEHRDKYLSCHHILDEYFDMMDGHCSVLKKSENQNNSPTKTRGRKKKKEKGRYVLSGMRAEWDQDFIEDDSLSFLHPGDPFTVPTHLRDQVAEFEDQYDNSRHRSHYKMILDNNPDPTRESLYDYFAQILEEHGPLVAEDPLLVGELVNFPAEAQLKIQEAGGFESFLLESLRFIKMGSRVGLAKHAVCLQQAGHGAGLDDLDVIADPDQDSLSPYLDAGHESAFIGYLEGYSSAQHHPILPNPYVLGFQTPPLGQSASGASQTGNDPFKQLTNGDSQRPTPFDLPYVYEELDLYTSEVDCGLLEASLVSAEESSLKSHAAVQDPSKGAAGNDPFKQLTNGDSQQPTPFDSPFVYEELDLYASEVDGGLLEASLVSAEESALKSHAAVQTCQETMRSVAVNTEIHEHFETCQGDINKKQKSNNDLEQQIKKMSQGCSKVNLRHEEDVAVLEDDIQKITANIQVTNKELGLFQQKLEEEVKKDQKEKKANQEALKALKVEIDELVEEHGSLTRTIREKKTTFDTKLTDFLELSNQSAAEKMSLEDEIKRCKVSLTSAVRRSRNAQVSLVESSRDQGLFGLYRDLSNSRAVLTKLDEAARSYPNPDLEVQRNSWRMNVQEAEKKISTTEAQFQEQLDQVRSGSRIRDLPPVNVKHQAEPAAPSSAEGAAAAAAPPPSSSFTAPLTAHPSAAEAATAQPPPKPTTRAVDHPLSTVFDKAIEQLSVMFPDYTRSDLMRFIQELRFSSGGSLSSMTLQDVVGGASQLILDHQEKGNAAKFSAKGRGSPAQCGTPPPVAPVWQPVGHQRATNTSALNTEDPCIICHEDMSPADICVLVCRHSFHNQCIRSWLKEQSTCPTCRDHALLFEDFPALCGRRRQAP